jgi:Ca-activated chloride channel homolog
MSSWIKQSVAALAALVIAGLLIWQAPGLASLATPARPSPAAPPGPCATVNLTISTEKAPLVDSMATDYDRQHTCSHVLVHSMDSGKAATALANGWNEAQMGPKPDAWSPAASLWLSVLRQHDGQHVLPADGCPSVTRTPLVIAMPEPMAKALTAQHPTVGWSDLAILAQDPNGWQEYGHPEWGRFQLGRTNPELSTTGLMTTVGIYYAGTNPHSSSDLTLDEINDPKVQGFVTQIERSVIHYADDELVFLSLLQKQDERSALDAMTYVSAIVVEEKAVWDYNHGNPSGDPATLGKHAAPRVKLVAIYPKEGAPVSDDPFCVLGPGIDDARHRLANDFLSFLRQPQQQRRFQAAGFRSFEGRAGADATPKYGIQPDQPKARPLSPPSGEVLDAIKTGWKALQKRARVLIVLDVSGSMATAVGGSTKLQLVQQAAHDAVDLFAPDDRVGLWAFSQGPRGPNHQELAPVAILDAQQRTSLKNAIDRLTAGGNTPLYDTVSQAESAMQAGVNFDFINAVILLTDGQNTDTNDRDGLISSLRKESTAGRAIRVFSIGYGADADQLTLGAISDATGGVSYSAQQPDTINSVFRRITSNF